MFSRLDPKRNQCMLTGSFKKKGYDWWWHSFTAINRKTKEEKAFFCEFFLCNPALGGKEPIFGQLKENKENKIRPSYMMVKAGCWGEDARQMHRFFGIENTKIEYGVPFSVSAEDCKVTNDTIDLVVDVLESDVIEHPEWMCQAGRIEMHLKAQKKIAYNVGYGASSFFRAIKAFEMYWHAEGIKTEYEGTVILDGQIYDVYPESSYGYQDKNWGRGFTTPWVWLSSNCLTSNITGQKLLNSVFEIGGGRPKIYFVPLNKKLLGGFYYEGEELEFNFSKFWTGSKTKFHCEILEDKVNWLIVQSTRKYKMETKISCDKKDMLLVNYEAPDGSKRHNNLYNGGTGIGDIRLYRKKHGKYVLIDDIHATHIGCEFGEYDE